MRSWGSAVFPLTVLLTLAALTFWLRHAIDLPEERMDGKTRHDPDYIIEQAQLRKLDKAGDLQYTLKATEIRHFPDDDSTDVSKPDLVYLHPERAAVTMSAELAHIGKDGKQVDIFENVRLRREATPRQEALLVTTTEMTAFPDEERAFTKSPVLITQGNSWLKGVGMQVNHKTQTYVLESQALGQFASKSAKKR